MNVEFRRSALSTFHLTHSHAASAVRIHLHDNAFRTSNPTVILDESSGVTLVPHTLMRLHIGAYSRISNALQTKQASMNSGITSSLVTDIDETSLLTIQAFLGLSINKRPCAKSHPCSAFIQPDALCLTVDIDPVSPGQNDPPTALPKTSKKIDLITPLKPVPLLHSATHPQIAEIMETDQIHEAVIKDHQKSMKGESRVPGGIDGHVGFHGKHLSRIIDLPPSKPVQPGFERAKLSFKCFELVRGEEKLGAVNNLFIREELTAKTHPPNMMKSPRTR
jgi:hypothetical protein